MVQIHKKFTDAQVRDLLRRYLEKKIERKYLQEIFGIKKRKFFTLVKQFRNNPHDFSIGYSRNTATRKISKNLEQNIIRELKMEKALIENPDTPVKSYNYSYIQDILAQDYGQKISLPTIINRAISFVLAASQPFLTPLPNLSCFTSPYAQLTLFRSKRWWKLTKLSHTGFDAYEADKILLPLHRFFFMLPTTF